MYDLTIDILNPQVHTSLELDLVKIKTNIFLEMGNLKDVQNEKLKWGGDQVHSSFIGTSSCLSLIQAIFLEVIKVK